MDTRKIEFIDREETIDEEVERTFSMSMEENLREYFRSISYQCSMMGVDIQNPENTRVIYYMDNE